MIKTKKTLLTLIVTAMTFIGLATSAYSSTSPFAQHSTVKSSIAIKGDKKKCGEGKCGDNQTTEAKKCGEGKCGDNQTTEAKKCGEGKCGDKKDHKKTEKSKCGEGKCGG